MSGLRAPGARPLPPCLLLLGLLLPGPLLPGLLLPAAGAAAGCELEAADGGGGRRGARGGAAGSAAEAVTGNGRAVGAGPGRGSPGPRFPAAGPARLGSARLCRGAGPVCGLRLRRRRYGAARRGLPGGSPPQDVCRIL